MSELRVSTETICFLIAKARALDAKVAPTGLASGSDPIDDDYHATLEDRASDPTEEELRQTLEALNGAEMADVVALVWLGRDDLEVGEWPDVLRQVADAHIEHPIDELIATPLLGDYLAEGLSKFGMSCLESGEPTIRGARVRSE